MQAFQISDSSGVWALNIGAYRLPDPESGTNFEPGIPTQARLTNWMQGQPTLIPCEDPREPVRLIEQEVLARVNEYPEVDNIIPGRSSSSRKVAPREVYLLPTCMNDSIALLEIDCVFDGVVTESYPNDPA